MSRNRKHDDADDNGFAEWGGYFQAKKAKLHDQYKETAAKHVQKLSDIFAGISIFVNGLTNPTAEELKQLMAVHGGVFQVYQNSATTHIIASNLPNVKINKLGSVPIVKPSWITDSISLNKLLDYKRYLLYTNQSITQPKLAFPTVTKTASDPKFMEEFYSNSRLHLIATLGAEFKQLVSDLRDKPQRDFPGRERLRQLSPRSGFAATAPVIMHIDMDCFFVSVGLRNRPELRGQPVAVTHARNPQRPRDLDRAPRPGETIDSRSSMSEIASCSYEARKCGVRNGMFLGAAAKLCPDIKTIPYDFDDYKQVATILYETIASYTLSIEPVSCDEMYVDVTDLLQVHALGVDDWASHIRAEIMNKTSCPCSTGFGANRLQARLATKRAKPSGSFYLQPQDVEAYMSDIPLADLPGVGRATLDKLTNLGLRTCGDVHEASLPLLVKELGGKTGETIWEQSKGVDKKPLSYHHERKSVSAEINYGIRFKSLEECHKFLHDLGEEVWSRLSDTKMRTRCVTLKLMVRAADAPIETAKFLGHGLCDNASKSTTTTAPLTTAQMLHKEVRSLYEKMDVDFGELRGLGIQLSKLEKAAAINPTLEKFLHDANPRRGRPRKPAKLNDFFKSTKVAQKPIKSEQIDLEVLKALPEDIRAEVVKEYNLSTSVEAPKPPQLKPEVKTPLKKSPFTGLPWHQLKPILYEWVRSELHPDDYDVTMLGEHFRQLALDRKIEMLKIATNFLHRTFTSLDCRWHRAYVEIVDLLQQGMVARYGSTLLVKRKFDCTSDYCRFINKLH